MKRKQEEFKNKKQKTQELLRLKRVFFSANLLEGFAKIDNII